MCPILQADSLPTELPGKSTLLMGMQIAIAAVENNIVAPLKLKIELPFDTAVPLLVYI